MPKVTISMPSELNPTASELKTLEKAFRTELRGVLSRRGVSVSNIWGRVTTETVVAGGGRRRPAKKTPKKVAGKKAAKKK